MKKLIVLGIGLLIAAPAMAGWSPGPFTSPHNSAGPLSPMDPLNTTSTFVYAGTAFVPVGLTFSGTVWETLTGTYASEADWRVRNVTTGQSGTFGPTSVGNYTTSLTVGPVTIGGAWSTIFSLGFNPGDTIEFTSYESYDDGAGIDQYWTGLSMTFLDPDTPQTINMGLLPQNGVTQSFNGDIKPGLAPILDYYNFTLAMPINNGDGSYLNIETRDPLTGDTVDTEIGLFDSAGILVATDDDGQVATYGGLYSMLSHGDGDPLFNSDTPAGIDGTLAAGSYTLVVGGYNTNFTLGMSIGSVVGGTDTGDYEIRFTSVPEPATMALLALGGLALVGRRR